MGKVRYSGDTDVLLVELASEPVDHAIGSGQIVVHFSKSGEPVLLEILDAKKFVQSSSECVDSGAEVTFS